MVLPSRENASPRTALEFSNVWNAVGSVGRQSLIRPSSPPVANHSPSGEYRAIQTVPRCAGNVARILCEARSHKRTEPSSTAIASVSPLRSKDADQTAPEFALNSARGLTGAAAAAPAGT